MFLLRLSLCLCLLMALWSCQGQVPGPLQVALTESVRQRYILTAKTRNEASNCGGSDVTDGWEVAVEQLFARTNNSAPTEVSTVGGYFNTATGKFSAPVDGIYYVSAWGRCETQACDLTIRANFDRVAGFGTDLVHKVEGGNPSIGAIWASHGVATMVYLRQGQQVYLRHESGNGNPPANNATSGDCLYDTNFRYGQLNIWLYFATTNLTELVSGTSGR